MDSIARALLLLLLLRSAFPFTNYRCVYCSRVSNIHYSHVSIQNARKTEWNATLYATIKWEEKQDEEKKEYSNTHTVTTIISWRQEYKAKKDCSNAAYQQLNGTTHKNEWYFLVRYYIWSVLVVAMAVTMMVVLVRHTYDIRIQTTTNNDTVQHQAYSKCLCKRAYADL